jgi:hypothetical protein
VSTVVLYTAGMKEIRLIRLTLILLSSLPLTVFGASADTLQGFDEKMKGEEIVYFSPLHQFANRALLTRTNGTMPIQWRTAAYRGTSATVVYSLLTGHSSGTSGGERKFDVRLNGKELLAITTRPKQSGKFELQDRPSAMFEYRFVLEEYDQNGDAFGRLYLTVPAALVLDSAVFEITGQDQQSRDWFMVFMHRDGLRIDVQPTALITRKESKRPLTLRAENPVAKPISFTLSSRFFRHEGVLQSGYNALSIPAYDPSVTGTDTLHFEFPSLDTVIKTVIQLRAVRNFDFHIIHHSHNDIGYSHLQQDVELIQNENIRAALRWTTTCSDTGVRPIWHVESLWAVENFLRTATPTEEQSFVAAVRNGLIVLSANYANVLTGLCRPEEQAWNTEYARQLEKKYGFRIRMAMITDIPGLTASALKTYTDNDVRYLSLGPNYVENLPEHGDRVGGVIREQGDVAFYWSPDNSSGKKLLVWTAGKGYSYFHNITAVEMQSSWEDRLSRYCNELYEKNYPYDIVQLRYTKKADNGPVDTSLCRFVTEWNDKYSSPRLVLSDVNKLFAAMEERYGSTLPVLSGEISPYWEDGAYSTAAEEMKARELSAHTIALEHFADSIGKRMEYAESFYQLHKNIVLFHEHTWGSWCSISDPDIPFTTKQWEYKKAFLDSAAAQYGRLSNSLNFSADKEQHRVTKKPISDFELDLRTGGISSMTVEGKNLVNTSAPYRLFQLIYALGVDSTRCFLAEDVTGVKESNRANEKVIEVVYVLKNCGKVSATYSLNKISGILSCKISFKKLAVREKESLHLALPFALVSPELQYGSGDDLLRYGKDQLPGSNKDFICAGDRVELRDNDYRLVIQSPAANLFEVGEIIDESRNQGAKIWKRENGSTSTLYLYLFNNYWHTNYKADQEGEISVEVTLSVE